jgi:hypothetical protein
MSEAQSPEPLAAPAPARKLGLLAVFVGMVIRPRSTLASLRDAGGLSWLWLAGLAIVMLIVSLVVALPISRAAAQQQVEAMREQFGEDLTPAQEAQIQQMSALAGNPLIIVVFPAITGAIALVIGWLFRGGVLYLFSLALGGQAKFGAMFRMGLWTTLPDVVRQIVTAAGTAATGRALKSGLSFLMAAPEGAIPSGSTALWQAFLSGIDVYWLWAIVLTVVGVAVTARLSWRKGLVVTLGYWVLTVLFTLGVTWFGVTLAAQFGAAPQ